MKTMISIFSTAILIIFFILFILFLGDTEISFVPFYIKMKAWKNVVGYLLGFVALGFICYEQYERGYSKALDDRDYVSMKKKEVIFMLRKSSTEISEKLREIGKEELEYSCDKGWTMVMGKTFMIVPPKENLCGEDLIGIVDCDDDEEIFFELLTKQQEL